MRKLVLAILLIVGLLFMAGCGTTHYTVHMRSGEKLTAVGEPEYKKDANVYIYKNTKGQRIAIQKDDVEKIVENLD